MYIHYKIIQKIQSRINVDPITHCWNWIGTLNGNGYGVTTYQKKIRLVHRLMHEYYMNNLTEEKPLVLHRCDNPKCCNPMHLYAGNHQDNMSDKSKRNRMAKGEKQGFAKLTEKQVIDIRKSIESLSVIAKKYNVGNSTIWNIKHRKTWKHIK